VRTQPRSSARRELTDAPSRQCNPD
jgi:hypothetical protein